MKPQAPPFPLRHAILFVCRRGARLTDIMEFLEDRRTSEVQPVIEDLRKEGLLRREGAVWRTTEAAF